MSKRAASWYFSYDGIDGHFQFSREERGRDVYGIEHGPFKTFREAKRELIRFIKSDIDEVKLTLAAAREAKAKGES